MTMRRDGGFAEFTPDAFYSGDKTFYGSPNKATFKVPHDFPRGWQDPFFVKFVPALEDPLGDLDALLKAASQQKKPDPYSPRGAYTLASIVLVIVLVIILIVWMLTP